MKLPPALLAYLGIATLCVPRDNSLGTSWQLSAFGVQRQLRESSCSRAAKICHCLWREVTRYVCTKERSCRDEAKRLPDNLLAGSIWSDIMWRDLEDMVAGEMSAIVPFFFFSFLYWLQNSGTSQRLRGLLFLFLLLLRLVFLRSFYCTYKGHCQLKLPIAENKSAQPKYTNDKQNKNLAEKFAKKTRCFLCKS